MFIDFSLYTSSALNRIFVGYLPPMCIRSNIFIFLPEECNPWSQISLLGNIQAFQPTDLVCYASVFQVITKEAVQGAPVSLDVSRRKNILIH